MDAGVKTLQYPHLIRHSYEKKNYTVHLIRSQIYRQFRASGT